MGNIKVILPDELEKEFRDEIYKAKGMKKGNITLAIEEAVRMWIEYQRQERSEIAKKHGIREREEKGKGGKLNGNENRERQILHSRNW